MIVVFNHHIMKEILTPKSAILPRWVWRGDWNEGSDDLYLEQPWTLLRTRNFALKIKGCLQPRYCSQIRVQNQQVWSHRLDSTVYVSTTTPFMHLPFTWTSQFVLEHLASDCPVEAVELDIYEDFRFWYVFKADSQFTAWTSPGAGIGLENLSNGQEI